MSTRSARTFPFLSFQSALTSSCQTFPLTHCISPLALLCIDSGPLQTPLLMDFLNTPEKLNRRLTHLPLGRFGEAVEQAKAVLFRTFSFQLHPK